MEIWRGEDANIEAAQEALLQRAKCDKAARMGFYNASMERIGLVAI
jgi:fructose-bisphosphate aldolase class I